MKLQVATWTYKITKLKMTTIVTISIKDVILICLFVNLITFQKCSKLCHFFKAFAVPLKIIFPSLLGGNPGVKRAVLYKDQSKTFMDEILVNGLT